MEERIGREYGQRREGLGEEISITPHAVTDEDCLLTNCSNEIFRSQGLIVAASLRKFFFAVTIKGRVDLFFPGIKDGADEIGGRMELRSQDIEGRDA
jgi:hypothetical protein